MAGALIGENALSNEGETDKGNTRLAARYLRKPFIAGKRVKRAMLYISGLGSYEVYLNGDKVSDDVFAPTVSWYPEGYTTTYMMLLLWPRKGEIYSL